MEEEIGIQVKAKVEGDDVVGIGIVDRIIGVGTVYEYAYYNTPMKQAIREALMIVVEFLVTRDDIMDDSFTLRFETYGGKVQAILEKQ